MYFKLFDLTVQVSDLEEKLSSANSDLEVLSHSLSVKTAELQMQMNNNKVIRYSNFYEFILSK